MKYLIYPLGNPGKKYSLTRHNAARLVFTEACLDKEFKNFLETNKVEVFLPEKTFMNESGVALKQFLRNKKLDLNNLIVLYDDKDFEIGRVKISYNKSDGGHNGLKDIIQNLKTKNFYRLRIGIAPLGTGGNGIIPPHGEVVIKYVLENFTSPELKILQSKPTLDKVKFFLEEIIKK